ncbi:MAG: hypothetical protein QG656_621, partial [Candidatus Hydrogenedentes bacterium]|nr:hypothetical protein [Candidatus Hydrogenedentota bacterium]
MNTAAYPITGGDYTGGGAASKQLKEILKKIGVDAKTLRRTMVAAYEAEMNTVIHARRGVMKVAVDAGQVDVSVEDEGPGIPDIEWAMREGHSTAPAAAREIGFGAGMGLPNIKRNSDRFSIQSAIGRGTQLRFSIFLKPEASSPAGRHSVRIEPERCQQCLRCLPVCPTQAIRVRGGRPHVLDHLCVDCTACGEVCEAGALGVGGLREIPEADADTVLVIPPSFLVQFGQAIGPEKVIDALREKGFNRIRLLDEWEEALRLAVQWYAAETGAGRPTISPVCPAVVNLIQVRYPSLLGYLAPFATPIEAAREALTVAHAVFVAVCPAQHTVLQTPAVLTKVESVSAAALVDAMFPRMKR